MNENDLLFIGFDLHKDPKVILNAYDDRQGVTAKFNLNLLRRINRELGADFDLEEFSHYASYRPLECAARSFLISQKEQTVTIRSLNQNISNSKNGSRSLWKFRKNTTNGIEDLAAASGFYGRAKLF